MNGNVMKALLPIMIVVFVAFMVIGLVGVSALVCVMLRPRFAWGRSETIVERISSPRG